MAMRVTARDASGSKNTKMMMMTMKTTSRRSQTSRSQSSPKFPPPPQLPAPCPELRTSIHASTTTTPGMRRRRRRRKWMKRRYIHRRRRHRRHPRRRETKYCATTAALRRVRVTFSANPPQTPTRPRPSDAAHVQQMTSSALVQRAHKSANPGAHLSDVRRQLARHLV